MHSTHRSHSVRERWLLSVLGAAALVALLLPEGRARAASTYTCGLHGCETNKGENCSNCPEDCATGCGDGCCVDPETSGSCPEDCGALSAPGGDFATCPGNLSECNADVTSCCHRVFAAGTIIVPMDRCHQVINVFGPHDDAGSPYWCGNPVSGADDGMFEAYGLVYRLMQNGIPVYWLVNPNKDPPWLTESDDTYTDRDIDLWVVSAGYSAPALGTDLTACTTDCSDPVAHLSDSLSAETDSYNYTAFPVRGSAFVIAAEDRTAFDTLWAEWQAGGEDKYDFSDVDMYEIQSGATMMYQDFSSSAGPYTELSGGPVAARIDYAAPRLARQYPAGVSAVWLTMAKLDDPADYPQCLSGPFEPADAVYCNMTEADFRAGHLINGEFAWAWVDNWSDNSPCGDAAELTQVQKFEDFLGWVPGVREAGHVMFMDAAVGVIEGCTDHEMMGLTGTGLAVTGDPVTDSVTQPLILRYPANLFMQWGDVPTEFANGTVSSWVYYNGGAALGYDPSHYGADGTLMRLVTRDVAAGSNTLCTHHISDTTCDVWMNSTTADVTDAATYARYEDDTRNGVVFYMGGNQVSNAPSQLRMIMNALIATPTAPFTNPPPPTATIDTEVSRSAPIVTTIEGYIAQVQGTYEFEDPPPLLFRYTGAASDDSFEFPYYLGHLRAIDSDVISTSGSSFASVAEIFDAADGIPATSPAGCSAYFDASCRTIFTNVTGTRTDNEVPITYFTTGNVDALQPLLGSSLTTAEAQTLIARVHAGRPDGSGGYEPALGGINRSTVAIIGQSPLIGVVRPKIAYVGALDGMMHAICADLISPCESLGQELWAYIPRTELGRLRKNTQRIDGSPKVADIYGDFDGDGRKEYQTVMVFQTGVGQPGFPGDRPAVIAMNITDPSDPKILWEVTAPETRESHEMGVGLTLAMGPILDEGVLHHLVYIQTNEGGTTETSGMVVTAVDTITGEEVWQQGFSYPNARSGSNPPVPATGYPGGVAVIDLTGQGWNTHVLAASLYGDVWMLDANTGDSVVGTDAPAFRFSTDYHPIGSPPTVFRDTATGKLNVMVVSGGYGDLINSSWSPNSGTCDLSSNADEDCQYAVAFPIDPIPTATLTEDDASFVINLGSTRGYSQAAVSGDSVFIVTDDSDVNSSDYGSTANSGLLSSYSLSGGGSPITVNVTLPGGAASVDIANNTVYSGAGSAAQKISVADTGEGSSVVTEWSGPTDLKRALWLRTR